MQSTLTGLADFAEDRERHESLIKAEMSNAKKEALNLMKIDVWPYLQGIGLHQQIQHCLRWKCPVSALSMDRVLGWLLGEPGTCFSHRASPLPPVPANSMRGWHTQCVVGYGWHSRGAPRLLRPTQTMPFFSTSCRRHQRSLGLADSCRGSRTSRVADCESRNF
jgi:hypothetical protein